MRRRSRVRTLPTSSPKTRNRSTSCSKSAALPDGPVHRLRQGPRHAPLQAAGACQLRFPAAAGPGTHRRKARLPAGRSRAWHRPGPAFVFFTSGTTGPAKGVVLTHASLIDRARVAAATESLKDTDVAMAYLPPGWIGQNLFSYVQPMVVGYCVCCPEFVRDHAGRYAGDGADLFPGDAPGAGSAAHPGLDAHGGYGWVQSTPVSGWHGRGPAHRCGQDGLL